MKSTVLKRLRLNKESLRALQPRDLALVAGGSWTETIFPGTARTAVKDDCRTGVGLTCAGVVVPVLIRL